MDIKIIGIDASLSSTGFVVANCNLDESYKDYLFELLTTNKKFDLTNWDECFRLTFATEISENKETAKKLAAARKRIREAENTEDGASLRDLTIEEELSTKKITDQVNAIMSFVKHEEIDPNVTFIAIEDYSYHSPGSLTQLAEMKGVLKVEMNKYISEYNKTKGGGLPLFYFTANINTVKKVAARNGNANKELICEELGRFGYKCDIKQDDEADAIGVALATYYAIYHRIHKFEIPKNLKAKERKYFSSFLGSLNTYANRIGSNTDLSLYACN